MKRGLYERRIRRAHITKQGTDALVAAVVKGKGAMPRRAGKPALVNEDIKAAVEYIVSQAK